MTDVERLKQIAVKGGETTKQRKANDPEYYHRIAKLGGAAGKGKMRGSYKKRRAKNDAPAVPVIQDSHEVAKSALDTLDALIGDV